MFTYTMSTGRQIFVDDEDAIVLNRYHINTIKTTFGYTRYAVCKHFGTNKHAGMLHRIILNIKDRKILVDHDDGNGLNCTKDNLRICTSSQNQQNRRLTKIENEVRGLYFREDRGYWAAYIKINGKQINLGAFHLKEDAIIARLKAEKIYFSHFNGPGTTYINHD